MLLFILVSTIRTSGISLFQYISCYCLSNVIPECPDHAFVFQYISCYCLSYPMPQSVTGFDSFQYISCYCLSDSHCMSLETQWYFNTSHVTVYLCISIPECVYIRISIHLMLLFIRDIIKQAKKFGIFQYISCYCLSLQGKLLQFV